jgi:hypothetical protein
MYSEMYLALASYKTTAYRAGRSKAVSKFNGNSNCLHTLLLLTD